MKVLFLHGYKSSPNTNKFAAIEAEQKFCFHMDYENTDHADVFNFYMDKVREVEPDVIVGHSLGGYFALLVSTFTGIPCVLINPQLCPKLDGYFDLTTEDFINARLSSVIHAFSYIERGDEVIDVPKIEAALERYSNVTAIDGGNHRVQFLDNINKVIKLLENYEGVH